MLIDWTFMVSPRITGAMLAGLKLTLIVTIGSAIAAMTIGAGLAFLTTGRSRLGRRLAEIYVAVFRNVPLLVVLFFIYFGMPDFLPPRDFPFLYGASYETLAAIVAVTLVASAFVAEVVRAGIEAVPAGQIEASEALGLTRRRYFRLVILPQLLPIVLPGLCNETINIVKNSTYGMTIGLAELIWQAQQIEAETFRGFEAMTAATLVFLCLNGAIFLAFSGLEKAFRLP